MKKHTAYYVIGAVLVGTGIYLFASKKNKTKDVVVNLNPPLEVTEEVTAKDEVIETAQTTVFTALDKLKALIDSIKSKKATTPAV
jgi:hypothetical protein